MPKRNDIHKILVIGSGPIIIGQAAEFDYSGTQACLALKEEGYETVLVNSNPATIMTDTAIADQVYIEPLTVDSVSRIIRQEYPDAILPTLGGQIGLNLAVALAKSGILDELGIELLGTKLNSIDEAEDREKFKELMKQLGEPVPASKTVNTVDEALAFANQIGYPVIVRPAFTMGGTGGGICHNDTEMAAIAKNGLELSPATQCLIEKSIAGYKEIEFEVMRDAADNVMVVCCMENFDPVGIHTGDSIVFAPNQTITDHEYQMLRDCALKLIRALKIEGGCNVQLALDPNSDHYDVIEVNPRVSRSSALASKATGHPIAKMAAKIAVGLNLDEIKNPVTKTTYAEFEPALDYVVCKIPRWPFDKFTQADRQLGTQMKATGEVMAIGRTAEEALQKAIRSLEIDEKDLFSTKAHQASSIQLEDKLSHPQDDRLFYLAEAFRRGYSLSQVHQLTKISPYFLDIVKHLVELEDEISEQPFALATLTAAKKYGSSDPTIARLCKTSGDKVRQFRKDHQILPAYKMIDTCAAEFASTTPYFYSSYDHENESMRNKKPSILVIGSGPIRIGQGVEFDYATVHSVKAIQRAGYEAIIINSNPETVSTDFSISDKLYFEPLTLEDILNVIDLEHPQGVIVQFGGQTAINLAAGLADHGVKILGTTVAGLNAAEDREVFDQVINKLHLKQPVGLTATKQLAIALKCIGIMNIQFIVHDHQVYVLEVNPRASRTVPFLSKITGIEMAQVATRVILGQSLASQGLNDGLYPEPQLVHVKAPVFSFNKLANVDSYLSPEMKSTGEVMGSDTTFAKALYKAFVGSHVAFPDYGKVLLTIEEGDEETILPIAQRFAKIGCPILTTPQAASFLADHGLHISKTVTSVDEINQLLKAGQIDLVVNTMRHDYEQTTPGFTIRQDAIAQNVPLMTALDTVQALLYVKESQSLSTTKIQ